MDDLDSSGYDNKPSKSTVGLMIAVAILIIMAFIVLPSLYFTCTWPFNGSDSCKCSKSGGTYSDKKCQCPSTTIIKAGICETCPADEVASDTSCVCAPGSLRDVDGKCKTSSIYSTDKYGTVYCPTGFTTAYNDKMYINDKICNKTTKLCDACVTTDTIYPTTYTKMGVSTNWPERAWDDPMADGYDIKPVCTGGRTMGYQGGTYITNALPLNC
jgi:hypothetical protein